MSENKIQGIAPEFEVIYTSKEDAKGRRQPSVTLRVIGCNETVHEWDMAPDAARTLADVLRKHAIAAEEH